MGVLEWIVAVFFFVLRFILQNLESTDGAECISDAIFCSKILDYQKIVQKAFTASSS